MSIRLRFTLIYSAILAVTLAVFGFTLYSIQSQSTLDDIKNELRKSSETLGESVLRSATTGETAPSQPPPDPPANSQPKPPMSFQTFSSDQGMQDIPEREIVRILDSDGNLVASPYGRSDDELPLSDEGLETLKQKNEWWQTADVKGREMLIFSRPILAENKVLYILQVARPLSERNTSLETLGSTLLLASSIVVVIAFGIGWLFSGFVMRPIKHITQTAQTIGEESDFNRRVDYKGPQDEVGQLASTFNSMLARLQDSYQRVARTLEKQRDFVADVSHELRTPLTTLRGNLELIRRQPSIPAEEQVDIHNDMVEETDRLIRLVNDLLVLARTDAARDLKQERVPVRSVLDEVARQCLPNYAERVIHIDADKNLAILGDRDAVKQVLLILVDNARKYTGGEITIRARRQNSKVIIKVIDEGNGLPPEKIDHLFDRFYRRNGDNEAGGFGLGLPIAKSLAEAMNGSISITSEPGKGCEVTLDFHADR